MSLQLALVGEHVTAGGALVAGGVAARDVGVQVLDVLLHRAQVHKLLVAVRAAEKVLRPCRYSYGNEKGQWLGLFMVGILGPIYHCYSCGNGKGCCRMFDLQEFVAQMSRSPLGRAE